MNPDGYFDQSAIFTMHVVFNNAAYIRFPSQSKHYASDTVVHIHTGNHPWQVINCFDLKWKYNSHSYQSTISIISAGSIGAEAVSSPPLVVGGNAAPEHCRALYPLGTHPNINTLFTKAQITCCREIFFLPKVLCDCMKIVSFVNHTSMFLQINSFHCGWPQDINVHSVWNIGLWFR